MRANKKNKWQLESFDSLRMLKKGDNGSIWQGNKGLYVIQHLEEQPGLRTPFAKVILNNKFLTGLFRTKKKLFYSGDIKEGKNKKFLLFIFEGNGSLEIKKEADIKTS